MIFYILGVVTGIVWTISAKQIEQEKKEKDQPNENVRS